MYLTQSPSSELPITVPLFKIPFISENDSACMVTPTLVETVIVLVAVLLPSTDVAVIIAVPFASAVTFPVLSTDATLGLLLVNVTDLFEAFAGAIVAVIVVTSPTNKDLVIGVTLIPVTGSVVLF